MNSNSNNEKETSFSEKLKSPSFLSEISQLMKEINSDEISPKLKEIFKIEDLEKRKAALDAEPKIKEKLERLRSLTGQNFM
ncbi:MAG: hypothetical protein ACRC2K_01335 [Clostridium sp.]